MSFTQTAATFGNRGVAAAFLVLWVTGLGASAATRGQENLATARKFDEFEDMRNSDLMAHLDLFAQQLEKEPSLTGSIVGYCHENYPTGSFLRNLYGFRDYLVNKRGVQPERLRVVNAGVREKTTTELWLVPTGTNLPVTNKAATLQVDGPFRFDNLFMDRDCEGEYIMERPGPEDALKFFGEALRETKDANGFILVHPSARAPLRQAVKLAADSKASLVKQHGVGDRIRTAVESPRICLEMHLWLAPSRLMVPKRSSVDAFFQLQLMSEAERDQYTVRLAGFSGNRYTPDHVLRRRIPGLQEGEIFTKGRLHRDLASLSRLKQIKPVSMQDVEVWLVRKEKMIDLWINVLERRRQR